MPLCETLKKYPRWTVPPLTVVWCRATGTLQSATSVPSADRVSFAKNHLKPCQGKNASKFNLFAE